MFKNIIFLLFFTSSFAFAFNTSESSIDDSNSMLEASNINKDLEITSIMNSAIKDDAKATKIFIAAGDNINKRNYAGVTALHLVARNSSYGVAKILIDHRVDINVKDQEGWTPLMRASLAGDKQMINLLVEHGAKIWLRNVYNESAFIHATMADCLECVKILLNKSSLTDIKTNKEQLNESLNIANKRYNKPLIALIKGNFDEYNNNDTDIKNIVLSNDNEKTDSKKNIANKKNDSSIIIDVKEKQRVKKILYVFAGRVISKSELLKKDDYIASLKNKNNQKNEKINEEVAKIENNNLPKLQNNFEGQKSSKNIRTEKKNLKKRKKYILTRIELDDADIENNVNISSKKKTNVKKKLVSETKTNNTNNSQNIKNTNNTDKTEVPTTKIDSSVTSEKPTVNNVVAPIKPIVPIKESNNNNVVIPTKSVVPTTEPAVMNNK